MTYHRTIFSVTLLLFSLSIDDHSFASQRDPITKDYYSKRNIPSSLVEEISKDKCKPNLIDFNVCEEAKKIANELAKDLPTKSNNGLLLERAAANEVTVSIFAVLGYDKKYLQSEIKKNNFSEKELEKRLEQGTLNSMCRRDKRIISFLNLGGKIKYEYLFQDKEPYTTIVLDRNSCSFANSNQ